MRELGVFANDPDDGEILYAVTSDSAPDYLPPEGGSTAVSQEFAVYISASNASDVKVSIDPGALATMGYVQLSINTHNEDPESHPDIREKITENIAAHNKLMTAHPDIDFVQKLSAAADGIHYRTRNGKSDQVLDLINQLQATLSQGTVPSGNTGSLAALLSGIVHQIKALSGKTNWWETPKDSFETLSAGVVAGDVSNPDSWWVKLGGTIPLIIQGGMHNNGKNCENDSSTCAYTVSYPVAFPNACFTITGSPERNKNDRYAYRTGYHIIWKKESQFRYAIGTEQQGQYFEWVAIGR